MFNDMDYGFDEISPIDAGAGPYIPDAGECMRCGMCVSHCPTFRLFQVDEETPRRRIRSISKLLIEKQALTAEEQRHLHNCVQCRVCETVCPSRMAYGTLFDQALLALQATPGRLARLAFWLIDHKRWRAALMPILLVYRQSGLQTLTRLTGVLKKLGLAEAEALLSKPAFGALAGSFAPNIAPRGRVALFTGCLAEHFDRDTLTAIIRLLNSIGYAVEVPTEQSCCGAIHQHNGLDAQHLLANNLNVFNGLEVEAVLYAATGCGAMLSEYPDTEDDSGQIFQSRLQDIHQFLLDHWPADLQLKPAALTAAVHEPCSQRNILKNQQAVYALLEKIPGLQIAPLADNQLCCGAGGSYMLTHPDNARQLLDLKLQSIAAAQADVVLSSNFGCTVFINAHDAALIHPLSLLAQQLPTVNS